MKILYRFLESWDAQDNHYVVGIIYSGFSTPFKGSAVFSTLKSMKEQFLSVDVESIKLSDIPDLNTVTHRFDITSSEEITIPDEDDEWTPCELLEKRQIELGKPEQYRKTA